MSAWLMRAPSYRTASGVGASATTTTFSGPMPCMTRTQARLRIRHRVPTAMSLPASPRYASSRRPGTWIAPVATSAHRSPTDATPWIPGWTRVRLGVAARQAVVAGLFACARLDSGQVYCWGDERDTKWAGGSLSDRTPPTPVALVKSAVDLSADGLGACAVTADADAICWGGFQLPGGRVAGTPTHLGLGRIHRLLVNRVCLPLAR